MTAMLIVGFLFGGVLAILHLTALWFSVRRIPRMARPGLWLVGTAVLRITAVAAAFVWLAAGGWQRLMGCLAGFVIVRWVAVHRIGGIGRAARKGSESAH
jgi:F1F0 ATPase subunit 2